MSLRLESSREEEGVRNLQLYNSTNRLPHKGYRTVVCPLSTGLFPNSASIGQVDWLALFPMI